MTLEVDLKSWAGIENDGDGVTLAVAFTDIMDSTKLANTVGNQAMFAFLRKHFERARVHCSSHRGFEIKLIGDGYMAAFRTAADALQFALAFRQDTGDPQISIRVGIDQGKVRIWENDIYGLMVNFAARLLHSNLKDEEGIYISNAAQREILSEYGKSPEGFRVVPLGRSRPMKGFNSSEPVYQVVTPDLRRARQARRQPGTTSPAPSLARGIATPPELRPPQNKSQPRWMTEMRRVSLADPPLLNPRKKPDDK